MMLWQPLIVWVGRQFGYDLTVKRDIPTTQVDSTTQPSTTGPSTYLSPIAPSTAPTGVWRVAASVEGPTTAPMSIGSAELHSKDYNLQVTATPRGAGISSVVLNQYLATIYDKNRPFHFEEVVTDDTADRARPLSTRSVRIGGNDVDLSGINWNAIPTPGDITVPAGSQALTFRIELSDGTRTLQLDKTYIVHRRDVKDHLDDKELPVNESSQGYEVDVIHTLRNPGTVDIGDVKIGINGPVPPPSEAERYADTYYLGGLIDSSNRFALVTHAAAGIKKDAVNLIKGAEGQRPLWIAATTTYFDAILRQDRVGSAKFAQADDWWENAEAVALKPDATNADRAVIATINTKSLTVRPGATSLTMHAFFGPRSASC
ncbi:MAG: hypothetical protein QM770_14800 [Tepidisphaeraceae bacterium]